jgi:hypothetical protein
MMAPHQTEGGTMKKQDEEKKPLSAGQMRALESKANKERRKKAQQIGYVVGYGIGN